MSFDPCTSIAAQSDAYHEMIEERHKHAQRINQVTKRCQSLGIDDQQRVHTPIYEDHLVYTGHLDQAARKL